jgi:hypothetical protein
LNVLRRAGSLTQHRRLRCRAFRSGSRCCWKCVCCGKLCAKPRATLSAAAIFLRRCPGVRLRSLSELRRKCSSAWNDPVALASS